MSSDSAYLFSSQLRNEAYLSSSQQRNEAYIVSIGRLHVTDLLLPTSDLI
ncbi:hypothetical protein N9Y97_10575 [Pseudomonadales bacterium]|nr:hypothetical protein [Pseudomonadales bacterium]